eukprot:Lankesteria_metandrocarpae@DN5096_c0_g1_i1.p1
MNRCVLLWALVCAHQCVRSLATRFTASVDESGNRKYFSYGAEMVHVHYRDPRVNPDCMEDTTMKIFVYYVTKDFEWYRLTPAKAEKRNWNQMKAKMGQYNLNRSACTISSDNEKYLESFVGYVVDDGDPPFIVQYDVMRHTPWIHAGTPLHKFLTDGYSSQHSPPVDGVRVLSKRVQRSRSGMIADTVCRRTLLTLTGADRGVYCCNRL